MMMEYSKVSPNGWRKQTSYHRVPTAVSEGQSFDPFQDAQIIPPCWCCPVIRPQGHWFPSQCTFLTSLDCPHCCSVALQMRLEDWETMVQIHSASHQLSYRAQQRTNMGSNYSFLSFLPLSPSIVFLFPTNKFPGSTAGSVKCHMWCNGCESATHHEMYEMPKCVYVWMMCLSLLHSQGYQAMEPPKECSWPAPRDAIWLPKHW